MANYNNSMKNVNDDKRIDRDERKILIEYRLAYTRFEDEKISEFDTKRLAKKFVTADDSLKREMIVWNLKRKGIEVDE